MLQDGLKKDAIMGSNGEVKARYSTVKRLATYLILGFLLACSFGLWRHFENQSTEREERRFERRVNETIQDITDRLERYKMILQGGAGVFMASEEVSREEWRAYVEYRRVQTLFPGIHGLGFAPVIRRAELEEHIRSMRSEGFPDYTVWPEGERDEYTPVIYLEPMNERLRRVIGYDMFSEAVRRAAMTRARDTGEVSISGRVRLVGETEKDTQPGFLMYVPVYGKGTAVSSPEERRAAIRGYVYGAFRMKGFIKGIFGQSNPMVCFRIYDGVGISSATLMYESHVDAGATDPHVSRRPRFIATKTLDLYGHQWTLTLESTPLFEAEADLLTPKIIFGGGILISLLLFLLLRNLESVGVRAMSLAREMTAALRESEARYQILTDNLSVGVSLIGPGMEVLAANATLRGWFPGLDPETHPLCFTVYSTPPLTEPCEGCPVVMAYQDGEVHMAERPALTSLGERLLRITAVPVRGADGRIIHVHATLEDITQQKQLEQETIAREAAEEANRQKSRFLSHMSHEIRTPMNAILGFAQILEHDPSLTPRQKEQVRSILRSGNHLLKLINDILDLSKIEAGHVELRPVVFCLADLMEELEMMFRSRAQAKHLQFLVDRDEDLPSYVNADEGKLRQVLINLVGNAIKFTERGGVALRVRSEPPQARPEGDKRSLRLVFEVEDSGPGIPESELERIFDSFQQGQAVANAGGTGLGLAISRRFVEMMGGRLMVESVVGKGSVFRFDVPCEEAEALPKIEKPRFRRVVGLGPGTGPWRILVVDDVASNRNLLHAMLVPLGFELRDASNGQEAIEIFQDWSPHAVLMDMRMPVMDGYEATRRIRAMEAGRTTPIIALTASAFKDAEEEVLATGVSAYIRKPFRPEELYEALGRCLNLRYVYAEEEDVLPERPKERGLTPDSLAPLPRELLRAMREAVAKGDIIRLEELISETEPLYNEVAQGLKTLAQRYDYRKLKELLGKGETNNG